MSRRFAIALLLTGASLFAQQPAAPAPAEQKPPAEESQLPPEEDTSNQPEKEYSFNPVQSKKEIAIGEFYFKKGDFKAAANRFREATKWNDGNAEAWLRLGDAEERKPNPKAARAAYEKYLELDPKAKNADEIRKKLSKLKS